MLSRFNTSFACATLLRSQHRRSQPATLTSVLYTNRGPIRQAARINTARHTHDFSTILELYMFPISILIATTAMASGIGGATFFAPLLILALGFPPEVAIGTGLITEVQRFWG